MKNDEALIFQYQTRGEDSNIHLKRANNKPRSFKIYEVEFEHLMTAMMAYHAIQERRRRETTIAVVRGHHALSANPSILQKAMNNIINEVLDHVEKEAR